MKLKNKQLARLGPFVLAGTALIGVTWTARAQSTNAGKRAAATSNNRPAEAKPSEGKASAGKAAASNEGEAAIRATAAAFVKAFNARDAKAVAALFAQNATMEDESGKLIKGRKAIEDEYAALFKAHPTARMEVSVKSVEILTPTTAIEDGIAQVLTRDSAPPSAARYSVVHVQEDGKWLMGTVRETAVSVPSNYRQLQDLGWAVGNWQAKADGIDRRFRLRWIANKNFMQRDFTVERDGLLTAAGTEIIGWDPRAGQIVSWTFDSNGEYAMGRWTPLSDGWRIDWEGVAADGLPTSSKDRVVHVPGDDNVIGYSSRDRRAGDMRLPDLREVAFDRVRPRPATGR